ncbi:MAG: diguanylate cyclase [Spirulina sp. SIO3F2]|nr:diguanylate cyclase [Spirulina sp. SIO3F2]
MPPAQRTIPLYVLITSQLIAQVIGTVSLVGYLSYRSGQQAVQQLSERLMTEVGARVNLYVTRELWLAMQVNRMNVEAVQSGAVSLQDLPAIEKLLWRRITLFKKLTTVIFARPDGTFRFVDAPDPTNHQQLRAGFTDPEQPQRMVIDLLDQFGNRAQRFRVVERMVVQERPWYQAAAQSQHLGWTQPFQIGRQPLLTVSAYTPFYNDHAQLQGIFAVNVSFAYLKHFLEGLEICAACRVVIVDQEGKLIADSGRESPFRITGQPDAKGLYWGKFQRLVPTESEDTVIAAAANHWQALPLQADEAIRSQFRVKQVSYWLKLIPLTAPDPQLPYPQWTIAVIVPQSEFMAEIAANNRRTVLFCLLALGGAIASGLWTSRRIGRSLERLAHATHALAAENFDCVLPTTRIREVESVAAAFRDMSQSLQQAADIRHNYQQNLERQIAEQTGSLRTELALRQQVEAELRVANQELKNRSQTDGLTAIANRRHFDTRIAQEWRRLQRVQQPLSLILFDVDYFKAYNDRYGHLRGDDCLVQLAQASQACLYRPGDLLARYGGEEFVLLLPETTQSGAIEIARRLQTQIAALQIAHKDSTVSPVVTVSMGIATVVPQAMRQDSNTEQEPYQDLIAQADQALYQAKQQGRNRFVVYSNIPCQKYRVSREPPLDNVP